ncbi:MAG: hypothetical protein ACLTSG_02865 [Lachnospiraceae bacterium]
MKKRIAAALCLALALCLLASCGKGQLRVEVWRRTADPGARSARASSSPRRARSSSRPAA